ncbi:MAG: MBG domain-containing protein, partial [Desulfobacteraceae bacterium]|nr:MBG domain-containing protein [Desulfobacteraceae bacterium]
YTINDGNGGNNYQVTTNSAVGTITPATLTIDAVTDSKTYDGTTSSTATPTVVGSLLGSDSFNNLAELYDSKNAGNRTLSASYTINDGNNGNNYQVTTNSATGIILPHSITVTADKKEKLQGASDPSLTYAVSWLASGDNLAGALIRSAGETSGDYPILQGTVDDANNPNYLITYVGANLTIDAKNTTVDNAITSANSPTNQQPWGHAGYGETGGNGNLPPQGQGGAYPGDFNLVTGGLISQFSILAQDGGLILEGGGLGGGQPVSMVLPLYTASNGSLATLAVFKTTVSGNGIAITPNGEGLPTLAPPAISGPGGPSFSSTITTPDGLTGEIKVSVHEGGVLQVSVPAGFIGLVDERQMMLIGLELARQNLKVKPADLQGVVIDFASQQQNA